MLFMTQIFSFAFYIAAGVVEDVFAALSAAVAAVIALFVSIFSNTGIIAVFYDDVNGLSFIGVLLVVGVAFYLVKWAFGYVKNLLSLKSIR